MNDFSDMIVDQGIPGAIENLKQMALQIWNADKLYISLFILFIIFYVICNHWIKHHKRHHHH